MSQFMFNDKVKLNSMLSFFRQIPFELRLGWRYTRAGKGQRRNRFISFISGVSMGGICLGVAALIIVLSVMNGFQKEVRDRMLAVVSHIELIHNDGSAIENLAQIKQRLSVIPEVLAAAPFIASQALMARGEDMRGVVVRGIDPQQEALVADMVAGWPERLRNALQPGEFGVMIGVELARQLGVQLGDPITLVLPGGQMTPAGVMPRLRQMRLVGVFEAGHYEFDSGLAYIHIQDAQRIFRLEGPSGMRLRIRNPQDAPWISLQIANLLGVEWLVQDWTHQNKNWFAAVQIEKRMMFIILTLIVAVAAFNLVSTLVMTVTDKRADIAILRTLGASPAEILRIFLVQGAFIGCLGTLIGMTLGLLVAFNLDTIVPAIESLFQVHFLPQDIYLISRMPSDPQMADIVPVVLISLVLSLLATIYPSWRASRTHPVEALRHE
jgi:lipoprotein-releasing system permease protein